MEKFPITTQGYEKMQKEIQNLKTVERPAVIQAIAVARAHGDLSENAEYHAARDKQSFIEGRIAELEDKTARAEVIDIENLDGDDIKFGATVTLVDEDTDEEVTYTIVGGYEADMKLKLISISSPLARALIGKSKGDSVEVTTPRGTKWYEVLEVAYKVCS